MLKGRWAIKDLGNPLSVQVVRVKRGLSTYRLVIED